MVYPRRAAGKTFFSSTKGHEGPRRKPFFHDHEENLCKVIIWFIHEGPRGKPFFHPRRATKDHEENLCKVIIWFIHEGPRGKPFFHPRRATKDHEENLCKVIIWFIHEGPRGKPFFHPRRATKDHEENLCKIIIWSIHEGPLRTPSFCPRRAAKKTFCGRRRSWSSITRIRRERVRFCSQASCFCHIVSSLLQMSTEPNHWLLRYASSQRLGLMPGASLAM